MAVGGLALVVLATLAGFMADWHSFFDWFADFRLVYIFCAMVPVVLWLRRDHRVVAVAAATIAVNAAVLAPWASRPLDGCTPELVTVSINAFGTYSDPDVLREQVQDADPDILFASELTLQNRDMLMAMFPHHQWSPEASYLGLFSKHPIAKVDLLFGPGLRPYYNAVLETPEGRVRVLGAHAFPPFDGLRASYRNGTIEHLAALAEASAEPVILLGDLNVTMFSPHYAPLIDAGLANVRRGRGVKATWPAISPIIPIDHIAHSDDFKVCEAVVGESFGSDHLPLRAGLARVHESIGVVATR